MNYDELRALAMAARDVPDPVTTTSYAYACYMSATRPVDVLALLDDLTRLRALAQAHCETRTEESLLALWAAVGGER